MREKILHVTDHTGTDETQIFPFNLTDRIIAERCRQEAKKTVELKFSLPTPAQPLVTIYQKILAP